jgi:amidase
MAFERRPGDRSSEHGVTRRTFIGAGATGGAALLAGGLGALLPTRAIAAPDTIWLEKAIPELQALMTSGALSSLELTRGYIERIVTLNPLLRAVLEINPGAEALAARLDNERRRGQLRGPLHGIPILVKDNVATDDQMQTTAGSLALVNSQVPADAIVAARLRAAGAVILGKANLGEWANFRGFNPLGFYGWTARGGPTHNPYLLSYSAFGSSSGSGVGPAANLCAAAVGTETDGSIVGPSNANLVVGLKPTLGLISQDGIIPISHNQDTAGPMGRTVTDIAVLLGALQSPFGSVAGQALPQDYTQFLQRGTLNGARIGVDRRFFDDYGTYGFPGDDDTLPVFQQALDAMTALGATLVDTDTGDIFSYFGDEFTALLFEFKVHIAEYLAGLSHTRMRTLADLIAFNNAHCPAELVYYGQELFEISESTSGDLGDPVYISARATAVSAAQSGIDGALAAGNLDAIVAPHLTNSTAPAVSGYPNLALPIGITPAGKPAGMLMYSTFLREPQLIGFAFDLEQELHARRQPEFLGSVIDPDNAGLCGTERPPEVFKGKAHLPHGRLFL